MELQNIPKIKVGIVAVSRDCFPASLAENRRKALVEAYAKKYDAADIYECPVTIIESETDMVKALEDIKKSPPITTRPTHIVTMRPATTTASEYVVPKSWMPVAMSDGSKPGSKKRWTAEVMRTAEC